MRQGKTWRGVSVEWYGGVLRAQCAALREMETVLTQLGGGNQRFMRTERLGYLSTCPANLGTSSPPPAYPS